MKPDILARIRTVVVDDEEPARFRLRTMLEALDGVTVIGEAGDGDQALELISNLKPNLVFLDIQMPGRNGIEVASSLEPPRPQVIFCTAYDRYAVEAFEQHAVDYLLKPVTRHRLGKAVDRARESLDRSLELVTDLKRAELTQARLLPQSLPRLQTLEYVGYCRPARGVGGDYYDFVGVSAAQLGLALADVSGKGIAAALLMAGLQGQLQAQAPLFATAPERLIAGVNRWLCSATDPDRFATFFFGIYDDRSRRLSFVNAGHIPPLLFRHDKQREAAVETLETGGPVVGVLPGAHYERGEVTLRSGDLLVLFTDGVSEAMNREEEEFGEERVANVVRNNFREPLPFLRDALLEAVAAHMGGVDYHDDLTFVLARGD